MIRIKNRLLLIIAVCTALLLMFSIFVKIDSSVSNPCRFVAQREWELSHSDPDKLVSRLVSNDSFNVQQFSLHHFNRPDYIDFSLLSDIEYGSELEKGEIVAMLVSHEDRMRFTDLASRLKQARYQLKVLQTGQKPALQEEARRSLEYAQAELEAFSPQLKRTRELFRSNLVSEQELELAEANYQLYQVNVAMQKARLEAAQSGEKSESVGQIQAAVTGLEEEVLLMEEKIKAEKIHAPISGLVVQSEDNGVILEVNKVDTLVTQIPVEESEYGYLKTGLEVELYPRGIHRPLRSKVLNLGQRAQLVNGRSMFIVTCLVDNRDNGILPGMTGRAKITYERSTLLQKFIRSWENVRN
jgi:hypothetical protein